MIEHITAKQELSITIAALVCFIICLIVYHLSVMKYIRITEEYFKRNLP